MTEKQATVKLVADVPPAIRTKLEDLKIHPQETNKAAIVRLIENAHADSIKIQSE